MASIDHSHQSTFLARLNLTRTTERSITTVAIDPTFSCVYRDSIDMNWWNFALYIIISFNDWTMLNIGLRFFQWPNIAKHCISDNFSSGGPGAWVMSHHRLQKIKKWARKVENINIKLDLMDPWNVFDPCFSYHCYCEIRSTM